MRSFAFLYLVVALWTTLIAASDFPLRILPKIGTLVPRKGDGETISESYQGTTRDVPVQIYRYIWHDFTTGCTSDERLKYLPKLDADGFGMMNSYHTLPAREKDEAIRAIEELVRRCLRNAEQKVDQAKQEKWLESFNKAKSHADRA
ncbi:hypothetical protein ANO11243_092750 [Dothideomycetidae sp. 11243]|nr:hypothetical protein ANO11243_092750 [fungal sp. No.11243]